MPLLTLDEAVQAGWNKELDGLLRFLDAERWRGSWNKTSRGAQLQQQHAFHPDRHPYAAWLASWLCKPVPC